MVSKLSSVVVKVIIGLFVREGEWRRNGLKGGSQAEEQTSSCSSSWMLRSKRTKRQKFKPPNSVSEITDQSRAMWAWRGQME